MQLPDTPAEHAVRVFVEFEKVEHATKALIDLNGRFFGGRNVRVNFYPISDFKQLSLANSLDDD